MNNTTEQEQEIIRKLHALTEDLFYDYLDNVVRVLEILEPETMKNYQEALFQGHYPNEQFNISEARSLITDDLCIHIFNVLDSELESRI